jgi:outer membrane protein, heavy metal efflux system
MSRSIVMLSVLLALTSNAVAAQDSARQPDLTLHEVYELARERSLNVQAARAGAAAAAARESSAALPPDPQVQLGAMNLSLPSLSSDMPGAMLPSIQLMQMIPTAGKLGLNGRIARQSTAIAESVADEAWWDVRARAAMQFYDIYQADRHLVVMEETLDWLRQFADIAATMYSVGSGTQSDVLRAGVEVARMEADVARMRAMRTSAAARLNALLDRPAATPIATAVFTPVPAVLPAADVLIDMADQSRPMLERGRLALEQARTRETLARREIWPDLSVGVQYGQRGSDMGTERMGSLMLGFTVPVFAGRRQMQMRTEAAAMSQMAEADLRDMRAQVDARIAGMVAELDRARTLIDLYRSEVLPQAEANVTSALASYRVGRVDFMTLVDAQMTLNEYRQEQYVLLAEYGSLIAELEMAIGRELPATDSTIVEET